MKKSHPGIPVGEFVEEYCVKPTYDADGVQVTSGIDQAGREHPDPVPMAPPVGFDAPEPLMQTIRRMVHTEEFNRALDREGFDTFEEAGDFDIPDEPQDPLTVHEALFLPPDERSAPPATPVQAVPPAAPPSAPAVASPPAPAPTAPSTST